MIMHTAPQLHTLQQFRDFFNGIPDDKWVVGSFFGKDPDGTRSTIECRCALGWIADVIRYERHPNQYAGFDCELYDQANRNRLAALIPANECSVSHGRFHLDDVNDGKDPRFKQATPRERVVAFLDHIMALPPPEPAQKARRSSLGMP